MTDQEIKDLVKKEIADFIKENKLTDKDIIYPQDKPLLKEECNKFDFITTYKKTKDFIIMYGKKFGMIIAILVFIINAPGYYSSIRFYSELFFQKSLPDEIALIQSIRGRDTKYFKLDQKENQMSNINLKEPESFIVLSSDWDKLNDSDYKLLAHSYLSGESPVDELYNQNTIFVPTSSGIVNISEPYYTSTADDFKFKKV